MQIKNSKADLLRSGGRKNYIQDFQNLQIIIIFALGFITLRCHYKLIKIGAFFDICEIFSGQNSFVCKHYLKFKDIKSQKGQEGRCSGWRIMFVCSSVFVIRKDHQQPLLCSKNWAVQRNTQCQIYLNSLRILIDTNLAERLQTLSVIGCFSAP